MSLREAVTGETLLSHLRNSRVSSRGVIAVGTVLLLVILIGTPLGFFAWGSFWSATPGLGGHFTLDGYRSLDQPIVWETGWNTLIIAVGGTIVATFLALVGMFVALKTTIPGRGAIPVLFISQYLLPSYVVALSWEFYVDGLINPALMLLPFVDSALIDINTVWGIAVIAGAHYSGVIYLLASGAFKAISASQEEAALMNGASVFTSFSRISMRLALPSIAIAVLLVFNRLVQSFGIPVILGSQNNIFVIATLMYFALSQFPPSFAFGSALGMVLLTLVLTGLAVQRYVTGAREKYQTVTGDESTDRIFTYDLGRLGRLLSGGFIVLLLLIYVIPLITMIWSSFTASYSVFDFSFDLTVKNYTDMFFGPSSGSFWPMVENTLLMAGIGAALGMILSMVASYLITKSESRMGDFLDFLTFVPSAIPGIVIGSAFLWIFLTYDTGDFLNSIWVLIIPLVTIFIVYGTRAANSSFRAISDSMEEQAQISGAGILTIFRRIFMPLIRPGFIAGYFILFIDFMKVLTIPLLLAGPDNEVVASYLWKELIDGNIQQAAAVATLLVIIVGATYLAVHYFTDADLTEI